MYRIVSTVLGIFVCSFIWKISAYDCNTKIHTNSEECCDSVPQFVTKELLDECGVKGKDQCEPFNCVLRKLILSIDNKLDKVAIKKFVIANQTLEWIPAIEASLQTCFNEGDVDSCETRKFLGCFQHNIYKNCPFSSWTNSSDCKIAKEHYQNCKPMAI